jgi:hypothetical protein
MKSADRAERIKSLAKVALAIVRRNAAGLLLYLLGGGRARVYDVKHNEMKLSLRRMIDDPDQPTQIEIRFDGDRVLFAEWNEDGFTKRSYKPGPWERTLGRYERIPALANSPTK